MNKKNLRSLLMVLLAGLLLAGCAMGPGLKALRASALGRTKYLYLT